MSEAWIGRAAGMLAGLALCLPAAPAAAQNVDAEEVGRICLEGIGLDTGLETVELAQRRRILACLNRETAQRINAQAPVRVDATTTLVSVVAQDLALVYTFRVDIDGAAIDAAQQAGAAATIRERVCGNVAMRSAIGSGASYQFVSNDRADRLIQRIEVSSC